MRILVTLPWGQRLGGAETMLQTVLDGASESAHDFELVFFDDGPWPREMRETGFPVEVIPTGRVRELHRAGPAVLRLAGLIRRRRPDLVLNWMPKAQLYGGTAAAFAGMAARNIWWQHGISTGHWTDRGATALPAAAVGCSSQAAAAAQQRLRPRRRTFVVQPGTPPPRPNAVAAPLTLPAGEPVVGIVGRLQPSKGQDRLLRAQALLRERGVRCHVLLVGGDAHGLSPDYARSLPELVATLGLEGSVTMTGQVEDAGPYIERMDVLANVSEWESFGITLIEGMAHGVPVLAVDAAEGPAEIVAEGANGVVARGGAPEAIADALEPLLASEQLRRQLGEAGRECYLSQYTAEAMRARFFSALESVVQAAAGGHGGRPG
jgi:glycosyltransferase involved in cell wall biosynthesis